MNDDHLSEEQSEDRTPEAEIATEMEPAVIGPVSEITEEDGSAVFDRDNIVWGNF